VVSGGVVVVVTSVGVDVVTAVVSVVFGSSTVVTVGDIVVTGTDRCKVVTSGSGVDGVTVLSDVVTVEVVKAGGGVVTRFIGIVPRSDVLRADIGVVTAGDALVVTLG
jgi:hypothetical protein